MAIELWDDETGNLVDLFTTEAEALREIRAVMLRDGKQAISSWALDRRYGTPMIRGKELVTLAMGTVRA